MPESRVRVLIINPKLNQAVGIKNALEALGGFEARPFTSPLNGLEFARVSPPDVAVLDLGMRSPNLGEASLALRKLNPKIKLILTNAPDEAVTRLRADGQIALPARARDIEPLLRELFPTPVSDNRPPTPPARPEELKKLTESTTASADPFEQLATDEPPVPTAMEGGTIREAVRALLPRQPLDESMYVVEITPRPSDTDEGQPVAVDPAAASPVPVEAKPTADLPPVSDVTAPPFDDTDADLDESTDDGEDADGFPPERGIASPLDDAPRIEPPVRRPQTVSGEASAAPPQIPAPQPAMPDAEIKIPGQRRPVKKKTGDEPLVQSELRRTPTSAHKLMLNPADLKRALMMTHEQIGTAASALILTSGDEVLAHSGEMPTQEIEELRAVIGGDWDAKGTQARIRYITLPTSRQEYVLHTRRTENGYALSMAFAGDLPVRDIRAQSDAVAATLQSYRGESGGAYDDAPDLPDDFESRLPFTAVWMLENPDEPLTADIAQAVVLEFDTQLRDLGWTIHAMNVHADFMYIFCDVQTTYLASEVVADLKRISAEAASVRRPDWSPDTLWADAYMALMPGRELGSDEVQSFLAFTRSRLRGKTE